MDGQGCDEHSWTKLDRSVHGWVEYKERCMISDRRITLPISSITEENSTVRTFTFEIDIEAEPGRFIMLTDFRGGEKPFSISDHGKGFLSVTVKKVGNFTSRLFTMKSGDIVSIRGAYGSSFFIPGAEKPEYKGLASSDILSRDPQDFSAVLCGGGFGLPPLYFLAKRLINTGVPAEQVKVIAAARIEEDLLFERRFDELGISYTGAAERLDNVPADGCGRICGTAADALAETGRQNNFDFLYASGPDLMMKSLMKHIPGDSEYQFLFERYMKCAIGICGSCVTDPSGLRICKEGPALWRSQVRKLKDFGVYRRSASGAVEFFSNRLGKESTDE